MAGKGETRGVNDILDRLDELSGSKGKVSLGEIVEHVGSRGYGPFLIVPALVELSPLGAVPGVPTFLAALIILFAMQILFGRRHLWLPQFVGRRSVSERKMHSAVRKRRRARSGSPSWCRRSN